MVNLTKIINKILNCNQCKTNINPETAIAYSECCHLYCDGCKPIICKDCNVLGTKQPLENDGDLLNLYKTLTNFSESSNSKGASMFKVPFDLLLEKHKDQSTYIIPESLLNKAKQSGFYPDNSEVNGSGRKSTSNVRSSTKKSRKPDSANNINEAVPNVTSKSSAKRPRIACSNGNSELSTPKRSNRRSGNVSNFSTPASTPRRGIKRTSTLSNGNNNSVIPKSAKKVNHKGENPIHAAVKKKNFDLIHDLVADGVDVNHRDNAGWTPLHDAVTMKGNNLSLIELLLQKGAIVNAAGADNKTALHLAIDNPDMINLLLRYGADPLYKDLYGQTPKDLLESDIIVNGEVKEEAEPKVFNKKSVYFHKVNDFNEITDFLIKFNFERVGNVSDAYYIIIPDNEDWTEFGLELAQVLAKGAFILKSGWCSKSLAAGVLKEYDDFAVEPEWMPGLLLARRNSLMLRPGLFSGITFFINNKKALSILYEGHHIALSTITDLIKLCGGQVLKREPRLEDAEAAKTRPWHAKPGNLEFCNHIILDLSTNYTFTPRYNNKFLKVLTVPWLIDCLLNFKLIDNDLHENYFQTSP